VKKIVSYLSIILFVTSEEARDGFEQVQRSVCSHKVRIDASHLPKSNLATAKSKTTPKPNLAMAIIYVGLSII